MPAPDHVTRATNQGRLVCRGEGKGRGLARAPPDVRRLRSVSAFEWEGPRVVRYAEEQAAYERRRRELGRERSRRRRADSSVRASEAQAKRQRRAADPELRERDVEAKRQRRAADAELRERDVKAKRQCRLALQKPEKKKPEKGQLPQCDSQISTRVSLTKLRSQLQCV